MSSSQSTSDASTSSSQPGRASQIQPTSTLQTLSEDSFEDVDEESLDELFGRRGKAETLKDQVLTEHKLPKRRILHKDEKMYPVRTYIGDLIDPIRGVHEAICSCDVYREVKDEGETVRELYYMVKDMNPSSNNYLSSSYLEASEKEITKRLRHFASWNIRLLGASAFSLKECTDSWVTNSDPKLLSPVASRLALLLSETRQRITRDILEKLPEDSSSEGKGKAVAAESSISESPSGQND